ncbi:MAG TPA: hypothetical protein VNQ79_06790 [Blastocatellia bacterium]|nr:hypothetical protein [Blastocatellia bacterium]
MNFAIIPQCPRCGDDHTGDNVICDRCRAEGAHTTYTKRRCIVCDRLFLTHYLDADPHRTVCDRVDCRTATAHLREAA